MTERLERSYTALRVQHKENPSNTSVAQIAKARLELDLALTRKAEKSLHWNGNTFYTQKDKIGPLLAAK